ncbi:unnamed protein product [Closterium sp. NIES-64]|nr:unnamed protein product [Closterium sp. NIES-64]
MCAFIVWLMKANVLPEATPSVLSQVAFQALIPCFMMTKVASTLSVQPLAVSLMSSPPSTALHPSRWPSKRSSRVAFQALIPCFMMTKVASTLSVQPLSSLAFLPLLAVFQVICGVICGILWISARQASLHHRLPPALLALLAPLCTSFVLHFSLKLLPTHPLPLLQILCGLVLGKLACTIAYRRPSSLPSPPSARHIAFSVAQSIGLSPSAAALLSGLPFPQRDGGEEGAAGGEKVVPGRGVLSAPGMVGAAERAAGRKESVVMAACAFGNSLTLPLVFLATLLTRADADRAAGYLALFMVGSTAFWTLGGSTAFWTLGYSMFRGGSNAQEEGDEEGVEGSAAAKMEATAAAAAAMGMTGFERAASRVMEMAKKVLNPPIYGVLAGLLIGATPLGHFFLPASSSAAAASSLPASSWLFSPATAGILHGLMEAAAILGALWVVCAVRLLLLPMLGTVAVTRRGEVPSLPMLPPSLLLPLLFLPLLFQPLSFRPLLSTPPSLSILSSSSRSLPSPLFPSSSRPLSLSLLLPPFPPSPSPSSLFRSLSFHPLIILPLSFRRLLCLPISFTFSLSTLSLASLSLQTPPFFSHSLPSTLSYSSLSLPPFPLTISSFCTPLSALHFPCSPFLPPLPALPLPALPFPPSPSRPPNFRPPLASQALNNAKLIPQGLICTIQRQALYNAKLIPQDPICALTLMIQTAMPSAQNLVLMAQLSPATKPLAGMLASLMLRQYAIAISTVITVWITVFLLQLSSLPNLYSPTTSPLLPLQYAIAMLPITVWITYAIAMLPITVWITVFLSRLNMAI